MRQEKRIFRLVLKTLPLALYDRDAHIKAHAAYIMAKAGDKKSALDLIIDLSVSWLYGHRERFEPGCVFVAPHALEATGDNALPQVLSSVCAAMFIGQSDTDIVQVDRVYHTGANAMERMVTRAQFEGRVVPGSQYVLVDDVISMGGTLAELANFIQMHGGVVKDVIALVNAGRNLSLMPQLKFVQLIQERFGDEFTKIFGIEPHALTANEAQYLVGFKSLDEIRNRRAAAEQEVDRRLRSKGISRAAEPTKPGAYAQEGLNGGKKQEG